jgi:ELWxxDGT repeat protein
MNPLNLLRRSMRSGPGRRPHRLPLRLELLENRLVPSDSTGTTLVKDFVPGSASSGISQMADLNGTLLLSVNDGGSGFQGVELYKSNGTAAGTTVVAGVEPVSPFTVIGNTAFFEGEDATTPDFELFRTDGTTAGTVWINPGGNMTHPTDLTNVNGTLFFSADDPVLGVELWKSDGTAAGTVLVKDINPGSGASSIVDLTNVNGTLFFVASDETTGSSGLWKSDGTAAGTVLVKSMGASNLTNVNGTLFFSGDDYTNSGSELWKSDGTTNGTKLVKDIYRGTTTGYTYYHHHPFTRPNSSLPRDLTNVNGTLFFAAYEPTHGWELWKSDGTGHGTVLVKDIAAGSAGSFPSSLTNVNGALFFFADDYTHGAELWKSDGSAAGTYLVKDIAPGSADSSVLNSSVVKLTNANGTAYFQANDRTHGAELWKSDGTAAGTVLVKDINPGSSGSYPAVLTLSGGHLFFAADDGTHGTELWDPPISPSPAASAVLLPGDDWGAAANFLSPSVSPGQPDDAHLSGVGLGELPAAPSRLPAAQICQAPASLHGWSPLTHRVAGAPPTATLDQIFAEPELVPEWPFTVPRR